MLPAHSDVLVVGGGPVGMAFALTLRHRALSVAVLETQSAPSVSADTRLIALSHGSRVILERVGVWSGLEHYTPIEAIHVSQKAGFGKVVLKASEIGLPALGYVTTYSTLQKAAQAALRDSPIQCFYGARAEHIHGDTERAEVRVAMGSSTQQMGANLVVVADGGAGFLNQDELSRVSKDYHQHALVTQVKTKLPHHNVAYERFTTEGPVALLPCGENLGLVWTARPEQAATLAKEPEELFLNRLHRHFGDRLGLFSAVGKRNCFPLKLSWLKPMHLPHAVCIGNAAQTLHPVAGQGFNLGLRDAWELGQMIGNNPRNEAGSALMLQHYSRSRRRDRRASIHLTDGLVALFSSSNPTLHHIRGMGLSALGALPLLRRAFTARMVFGVGG